MGQVPGLLPGPMPPPYNSHPCTESARCGLIWIRWIRRNPGDTDANRRERSGRRFVVPSLMPEAANAWQRSATDQLIDNLSGSIERRNLGGGHLAPLGPFLDQLGQQLQGVGPQRLRRGMAHQAATSTGSARRRPSINLLTASSPSP
ncbi:MULTISPECIES: hypothetical protein [unclassified Synechococcus]|uniref:hypothetical protein n=1 Tax=unclassified Synechococcus TaxID=2626047 RepID=UPI0039AF836A